MVSNIDMLTRESVIRTKDSKSMYLPNGEGSNFTHIESYFISPRCVITNVVNI